MVRRTRKRKSLEGIEEMSKGSRPRPLSIPLDELNNRLGNIFGEKPKKQRWVPPPLPEDMQGIKSSFEQQLGTTKLPPGRT
jgi:hypothetical protein